MPFPNEHAARLKDPKQYIRIRRDNDKFGAGIDALFGIKKRDGKEVAELQSIRFDRKRFTAAQARQWLRDHDHKPILFEPATGGKQMKPGAKTKEGFDALKGDEDVMEYPEISKHARRVVWCPKPELAAKVRKDSPHGTIQGYAAVWDNVDDQNEIVRRGSFAKSIEERVKVGDIKLMVKHFRDGGDVPDLIGTVIEAREDDFGLWFRAKLSKIKLAQDTRTLVKEGHVNGASVGFLPIKWNFMDVDGKGVVELLENKLLEITITSRPANMLARVTAKTFLEGGKDAPSTIEEILAVPESYISSLSLDDSSRLAAEKERAVALGKAMEAQLSRLRKLTVEPEAPPVAMTDDRYHSMQMSLRRAKLDQERFSLVG